MLSEVERSVKNPTVKLAWQVARALGCSLTEILGEPAEGATLVRAADRRALLDQDTGIARYGVSTSLLSSALEVATYVLPAGSSTGEMTPNRAGVVEHVIVVRGRLLLGLGDEQVELAAGDLPAFLADHAVCERQAALFALNLVAHYPDDGELVERMTSLATLFCLLAFAFYLTWRRSRRVWRLGVGLFFWALALGCKEIAIAMPAVVLIYEDRETFDHSASLLRHAGFRLDQ